MLTRKQRDLLLFINSTLKKEGVSPSFDEMREALELKSKSGIHRLIGALEERGYLRRLPNRARALEVLRLPDSAEVRGDRERDPSPPPAATPRRAANDDSRTGVVSLPFFGKIAAGLPIAAIRDETNAIDVPAFLLGPGEHYALLIEGDSMIELGILDGDIAIVRKTEVGRPGDIVVALVDQEEVTLKTLRRRDGKVGLEPANIGYETRWVEPARVQVQGRLAGLYRHYL